MVVSDNSTQSIVPLHPFSPYVLVMRAWLPLSRLGVLVLSLMSTCLFMHMCLASVDHHFIISGTYLELGSILLKNQQKLLFMHLSHRNLITVMHYYMAYLSIDYFQDSAPHV